MSIRTCPRLLRVSPSTWLIPSHTSGIAPPQRPGQTLSDSGARLSRCRCRCRHSRRGRRSWHPCPLQPPRSACGCSARRPRARKEPSSRGANRVAIPEPPAQPEAVQVRVVPPERESKRFVELLESLVVANRDRADHLAGRLRGQRRVGDESRPKRENPGQELRHVPGVLHGEALKARAGLLRPICVPRSASRRLEQRRPDPGAWLHPEVVKWYGRLLAESGVIEDFDREILKLRPESLAA